MGRLSQTSWSRITGDNVVFTEDKENVGNGQRVVFERRQNSVSGTMVMSVQNQRHRLLLVQNVRRRKM